MTYLFKTVVINMDGVAGFEVFRMDDGTYKCLLASWKGYMNGPGNLIIKRMVHRMAQRWQYTPTLHNCADQLIDCIIEFENK